MLFRKIVEKAVRQDEGGYYVKKEQYDQIKKLFRTSASNRKNSATKKPCGRCKKTIESFKKALQNELNTITSIKKQVKTKESSIVFGGF